MTRPVIVLLLNTVFIFCLSLELEASPDKRTFTKLYSQDFPNPIHRLIQKISHSNFGQKFSRKAHSSFAFVKVISERRRQKRHFKHFAHMTAGRKVNPHQTEKMLKERAKRDQ